MAEKQESNLTEIAALWKNESKSGEMYLGGYLGNSKLLILKNNYKEKENEPDYRVYVAPKAKTEGDSNKGSSRGDEVF